MNTQSLGLGAIFPAIVVVALMVGMVKIMGRFDEPISPKRKLPTPAAKVVTVPGGSHWKCIKCGRELAPGEEAVKIGAKVYCTECVKGSKP